MATFMQQPVRRFSQRLSLFTLLLTLIPLPLLAQGLVDGFGKGKGNLDLALSYSWEQYDEFFVGSESVSEPGLGTITTQSVSLYGIYGLTSRLDVIVNLPFIAASASNNPELDESALQDLTLCIKGRFVTVPFGSGRQFKLFGSIGAMVPTTRYQIEAPIAIGHRSTNFDARLIGQVDFGTGAFVAAQTGYILRSDVSIAGATIDVPNAFDAIVRAGYGTRRVYGDVWANLRRSGDGTDIGPGIPFPSNAISFLRLGGTLYVPITPEVGIGLGAGYTLSGENVGKAVRMSGGVVYRMTGG